MATRQLVFRIIFSLGISITALFTFGSRSDLYWLQEICFLCPEEDYFALNGTDFEQGGMGCDSLWVAQVYGTVDLKKGKDLLATAVCDREEQVAILGGQINWALGDKEEAEQYWKMAEPLSLLLWGKNKIAEGEDEVGVAILSFLAEHPEGLNKMEQASLSFYLGNRFFDQKECVEAVRWYEHGVEDLLLLEDEIGTVFAYRLAYCYNQLGFFVEAVTLLEKYQAKIPIQLIVMQIQYQIQRATSYYELDNNEKSWSAYDEATQLLQKQKKHLSDGNVRVFEQQLIYLKEKLELNSSK